jgi:hypothetical protein
MLFWNLPEELMCVMISEYEYNCMAAEDKIDFYAKNINKMIKDMIKDEKKNSKDSHEKVKKSFGFRVSKKRKYF